jgi:diguanylate cyclase (GGDEF)-like protein
MFRFFINQDDRRITTISGLTLIILILLSGFSVYRIMQPQTESMITSNLEAALENMVKLIENQITYSLSDTKALSTQIFLLQSLEKTNAHELKDEGIAGLIKSSGKILQNHFSGIGIHDPEGNLILDSGLESNHPEFIVALTTASDIRSELLWSGQFILRNSMPILNDDNKFIGRITTEQPMPTLTRMFSETSLIDTTGDFLLCAPAKENNAELDCFLRDSNEHKFQRMQHIMKNGLLPMHYALQGQRGIKFTQDYRQVDVVSAHSPVAYGLGAVLKIDEKQLYGHLADEIQTILVCLGVLVLSGLAILHGMTVPLIQKLIKSRDASIKTYQKLIQARNNAEKAEQRILQMATHDALTGLPNRHLLQDRIEQVLMHDTRHQIQMAVLFIDLDHFKIINDSLGHDIGDLLLKAVAERLSACVRNEDTVARQGGDEFIVVLNSIAESLDAAKIAQKILNSMAQPYHIHESELHIGGSIGIAVFPDDGTNAEVLLKNSDIAMYYAKENGRNNYQFFTDELNKSAYERHTLGLDLRYALERNELVLYYQPVMDMPDSQLYSVEALLRWRHPEYKLISPDKFISLAEETGLIIPIGEWVIKTVCMQIKAWQDQGYNVPRIAINLSGRQFRDQALIKNISRILDETGVDAKYITLEITESMLIDNIEKVVETLKCLNEMGIHISIDDFGTGYSSLSYLKRFPIHTLKIDRTFVRDIVTDKNDRAIVAAIIAMAHSLEIDVTAEGIETEQQLNLLTTQKCNHYQGYYFSKPVTVSEIENILKTPLPQKIHILHIAK